ncbi:PfkB family carbohydrate kinase [Phyllobacterium sp. 21LDTY02-6]|uniref:PfkB family carbohydrate kinase n=1 Tax=Phyllobacterium sp. 21LDTY02-6 TaxID=2944903 RepID=UPI00202071D2|nr:PfkB family carbohydrate kinase [Phyllobacterium sp. 21LDTY02-6]MCO4319427.1 PfkB family carbohydrate kinase [Phyllobacterium sp. 21LDTY02-6]
MRSFQFAAVGDNCVDRFQTPVREAFAGGNAVNVAVQLTALGCPTAYFGAIGDDADGRHIVDALSANSVNTDHVAIRPAVTAFTDIDITEAGERVFVVEEFGACRGYAPEPDELPVLVQMRHVHIGWLDDGGALRQALAQSGTSVSQDVSVNADPRNLDVTGLGIVFASAGSPDEARHMAAEFHRRGAALAVVTMGALGSLASDGKEIVQIGIKPVDVVDTTGAGDSFIAGFIAARSREGGNLRVWLEAGRDAAAATCTHLGGFRQIPRRL